MNIEKLAIGPAGSIRLHSAQNRAYPIFDDGIRCGI